MGVTITLLGKGFFEFHFSTIEDLRKIWALGVVNPKPGFLRFSCWTRGFKPQAQVQTHAKIWIRLMHLPQEYWRKTTLFEIAFGLGTPLSIDEATISRCFGMFARILVDVDLSEQLFKSVVVETKGHAFSIDVQYEKQPLFCANCNVLGHNLQNCMKLSSSNNLEGSAKFKTKLDWQGKKQAGYSLYGRKQASGTTNAPISLSGKHETFRMGDTQSKPVEVEIHNISNSPNPHLDLDRLTISQNIEILEKEGAKDDVTVTVIMKDMNSNPSFS